MLLIAIINDAVAVGLLEQKIKIVYYKNIYVYLNNHGLVRDWMKRNYDFFYEITLIKRFLIF